MLRIAAVLVDEPVEVLGTGKRVVSVVTDDVVTGSILVREAVTGEVSAATSGLQTKSKLLHDTPKNL